MKQNEENKPAGTFAPATGYATAPTSGGFWWANFPYRYGWEVVFVPAYLGKYFVAGSDEGSPCCESKEWFGPLSAPDSHNDIAETRPETTGQTN